MSLSNSLMYEGRLECGSERTAEALLNLPFLLAVQSELGSLSEAEPHNDLAWVQAAVLPSNPVCFLDCSVVGWICVALLYDTHDKYMYTLKFEFWINV